MNAVLVSAAVAGVTTLMLTPLARWLAIQYGHLDIPNNRSSHRQPTPRTGGLAILAGIGAGALGSDASHAPAIWRLLAAAVVLAAIALFDERRPLPRLLRLMLQVVVAAVLVWQWSTMDAFVAAASPLVVWLAMAAALVWLVGLINAYNFMDGLNGIAGLAALVTGAAMTVLALRNGDAIAATLAASVAAAAAGFLPFNLTSGSIFMGDTGSATLGLIFGGLVLHMERSDPVPVAAALPLAPFILDAAVTVVRRALRGERFFSTPHRSHYYQWLHQQGWSDVAVTALYAGLTAASAMVALLYDGLTASGRVLAVLALVAVHAVAFGVIHVRWSAQLRHGAART
jgi:UDP-N-acetylmuramyl pentapeptide phosphotransferase/UDP-N-acetylglucosamine-1-phosphate transferase